MSTINKTNALANRLGKQMSQTNKTITKFVFSKIYEHVYKITLRCIPFLILIWVNTTAVKLKETDVL